MDIALEILTLKGALVRAEVFPKKDGRRLVVIRSNKNKLTTDDEAAVITAAWVEAGEVIAKGFSSYREFIQENVKVRSPLTGGADRSTNRTAMPQKPEPGAGQGLMRHGLFVVLHFFGGLRHRERPAALAR